MASNLNVILSGATLQVVNTTDSSIPVNSSLASPTLPASQQEYLRFFPVPAGATVLNLPAATIWVFALRNLGGINGTPAGNITVQYQVTGGALNTAANSPVVTPNGVFIFWQPVETANGIIAVTLSASIASTPAEILMAA